MNKLLFSLISASFAGVLSAQAAVITLDGAALGAAPTFADGATLAFTDLTSDLGATPVDITFLNNTGDATLDAFGSTIISNDNNGDRVDNGDIVFDGAGDRGHFVITFSDLIAGNSYDISAGADTVSRNNDNFDTIFQLNGVDQTATSAGPLVNFNGIIADSNGEIELIATGLNNDDGNHVTVGTLAIEGVFVVPEPSSTALLGLGALGFLARRRR